MGNDISHRKLYSIGFSFILLAAAIGFYMAGTINLFVIPFLIAMIFFSIAYSLELWNEKIHTPFWCGLSRGFLVYLGIFFLYQIRKITS